VIQPIVEGNGEVEAVPILLRRLIPELCEGYMEVNRPLRFPRTKLVREADFRTAVRLAKLNEENTAVLVLFDADDDCARDRIPIMYEWVAEEGLALPHTIVMARQEYEACFLASLESLRGKRRIADDAAYALNPEEKRGAKEAISKFMPLNLPYAETADQPNLTAEFDLAQAFKRASSFQKLVKELCRVLSELGYQPNIPLHWQLT
jgi:hypothetical protein